MIKKAIIPPIQLANNHGNLPCRSGSLDTENASQPGNDISAPGWALIQVHRAGDDRLGVTRAAGEATGSAIDPRQDLNRSQFTRVNLDSELFGGKAKRHSGHHANTSKTQYCSNHK